VSAASRQYEAEQSRAMVVAQPDTVEPRNMTELLSLASAAAKSGFFGAKSPEQALLICMSGRDLGLSYAQALRAFHVIEGKPTLSADGMVAVCLIRRDVCEYFRTLECTNDRAAVETKRTGSPPQSYVFSMEDARRAGVASKQNWAKYPSRMLLARARAALARDVYPDLLLGLYDPDEIGEIPSVTHPEPVRANVTVVPVPGPAPEPAVVEAGSSPTEDGAREKQIQAIEADFARIGREGTLEGHAAVVRSVSTIKPSDEERKRLAKAGREAHVAIKHRATASHSAQAAFGEGSDPDLDAEGRL
jgi:hypothetical protein